MSFDTLSLSSSLVISTSLFQLGWSLRYRDFDRIVFLEIALYSMCTILDIVKLKRFKKGTDG